MILELGPRKRKIFLEAGFHSIHDLLGSMQRLCCGEMNIPRQLRYELIHTILWEQTVRTHDGNPPNMLVDFTEEVALEIDRNVHELLEEATTSSGAALEESVRRRYMGKGNRVRKTNI